MPEQTEDALLTPEEVATRLRISKRTLRRMVTKGDLRAVQVTPRITRFRTSDIEKLAAGSAAAEVA